MNERARHAPVYAQPQAALWLTLMLSLQEALLRAERDACASMLREALHHNQTLERQRKLLIMLLFAVLVRQAAQAGVQTKEQPRE